MGKMYPQCTKVTKMVAKTLYQQQDNWNVSELSFLMLGTGAEELLEGINLFALWSNQIILSIHDGVSNF